MSFAKSRKAWVLVLGVSVFAFFFWLKSSNDYYETILVSGGFDPNQVYKPIESVSEGVGLDFSTAVCVTLTDIETNKNWTSVALLDESQTKIVNLARGFEPSVNCITRIDSYLILSSHWSGNRPYSWELLALERSTKRLLLLAGTI